MTIRYHRRFERQYKKLPKTIQEKTREAIARFTRNPHDPRLHNHKLHGRLSMLRAFSVLGDLRIIFQEFGSYALVIFLDVGTHEDVYE